MITPKQVPINNSPFLNFQELQGMNSNHSEMDEGCLSHINKNLQSFPKPQFMHQLQNHKSLQIMKIPQPTNSIIPPKFVTDDYSKDNFTREYIDQYHHTRTIQSIPLQQVLGEIKDDSSHENKVDYSDILSVESRTLKKEVNITDHQRHKKQYFQELGLGKINLLKILKYPSQIISNKFNAKEIRITYLFIITQYLDMHSLLNLANSTKRFKLQPWRQEFSLILQQRTVNSLPIKKNNQRIMLRSCEQYLFWDYFIDFNYVLSRSSYIKFSRKKCLEESNILKDNDRTFSDSSFFQNESNRLILFKVLVALSHALPNLGYVQGLNQIAGVLLMKGLSEQHSFWIMYYMMKQLEFEKMYINAFRQLKFLNFAAAVFLRNFKPKLSQLFLQNEIDLSFFTTRWFLTLFSYDLPKKLLLRVWNLMFLGKWKVLLRISNALLILNHDEMIEKQMDMDEIYDILKNSLYGQLKSDIQTQNLLLKYYSETPITNSLIRDLETYYQKYENNLSFAEENLILHYGDYQKPKWKLCNSQQESIRSLAGSVNELLQSINSSELNERISEEKDSSYSYQQEFLSHLFQPIRNKGPDKYNFKQKILSQVASEKKRNFQINTHEPPQLIQFQVKQQPQKTKNAGSPKSTFSFFTIPKSSEGDQEWNINADDLQSQASRRNAAQDHSKGPLIYKNQIVAQNLKLEVMYEDGVYQINPESQPKKFLNLIVNQSKQTA